MRLSGIALATVVALASFGFERSAAAEEEYEVTSAGDEVHVAAKGNWHINLDYPWKVTFGTSKLTKERFRFEAQHARLNGLPKGDVKVSGCVCTSGDHGSCLPFSKVVTL